MRYLWIIVLLSFCKIAAALDIFGMDYYLKDSFVRIVDDERGTSIVLGTDHFFETPDSTDLNPIQMEVLYKVAHVVKRYDDQSLSITGHTDSVYSQQKRYKISQDYAKRIADFLVDAGVDPDRISEVSGEGDLWPIAPNDSAERRHLNRRVEITFLHTDLPSRVELAEEQELEEIELEVLELEVLEQKVLEQKVLEQEKLEQKVLEQEVLEVLEEIEEIEERIEIEEIKVEEKEEIIEIKKQKSVKPSLDPFSVIVNENAHKR